MNDAANHFIVEPGGTPTAPGRYVDRTKIVPNGILPGLSFQPIIGSAALLNFVSYEPQAEAPMHTHEEEQIVLVLEGELLFNVNGHERLMRAGDVAVIPPWVPHGARTLDSTCVQVDFFAPPRPSLREQAEAAIDGSSVTCD
jgi:mannose-6-phosphate isomerase-like protein (cupin superfamily)